MTTITKTIDSDLHARALKLGLWGALANWSSIQNEPWLPTLIEFEEKERAKRSLERRLRNAKLGPFVPMADFNWSWPKKIDRELIDELFEFHFVSEPANVILVGPNGVGKTMIAKNLVHQAVLHGYTARCISASELLNDLAAQESSAAVSKRLKHYSTPEILLIDELGYLASSSEHADLLFEVITRRYLVKPVIITTNKPFTEWGEVFPSAGCVVTLVDRLVHQAEILKIDGDSYRLKEAQQRSAKRKTPRQKKATPATKPKRS